MGKVTLAKRGYGYMRTTEKVCKFPGCTVKFEGVGSAKYCIEHRKPEYRKVIDEKIKKRKVEELPQEISVELNEIFEHDFQDSADIIKTCVCGRNFHLRIIPGVHIYPKYCEEHRSEYKVKRLLKSLDLEVA